LFNLNALIMNIVKRVKAHSPIRNIRLVLAAVGGTILTALIALPVGIGSIVGYIAVVGGVLLAVSQLKTIDEDRIIK
jgi:hypothetical protein